MNRFPSRHVFWFGVVVLLSPSVRATESQIRSERSLDGPWQFRATNPVAQWKSITVPSAMQSHEGMAWHGTGEYRREIKNIDLPPGKRVLLHFTAVATHAEVYWNGERIGEHLGGWTPFRFDITDQLQASQRQQHELVVKVDERVGHNTQGFLPIVQPHFGGIWGSVRLLTVPSDHLNDIDLSVTAEADLPLWSPQTPSLKDVRIQHESGDYVNIRTARRQVEVRGDQLFLNDEPLQIRGVLNWGYYPPTLEPTPSDDVWRADLRRIRSWGFNLMKCCLWVPSQRQLQIADEEGMLIWMEYPTWHPQLTPQHLDDLKREFAEFFAHVRNHPSVILHSLTCETGPGADIEVLKELTETCKRMIPGAIVEDDSSWIEWNRVTDFYDDHPYGNNHTWVRTLHRLRAYDALGTKPLVLGEAIGADTWTPVDQLAKQVGSERPYWLPYHFQANAHWLHRLGEAGHSIDPARLLDDSKRYAMLMRKYQMETFRREVPHGGYVVSVLRDFPLAAMGLIDYQGNEKWPANQWQWHGEQMLLLTTPNDARTFTAGGLFEARIQTATETDAQDTRLTLRLISKPGDDVLFDDEASRLEIRLPDVTRPTCYELQAELKQNDDLIAMNRWPLWVMPKPLDVPAEVIVATHFSDQLLADLEAGARVLLLPGKEPGSLPLQSHWFLRGAPAVFDHDALQRVPRELLIETQHFDLASDVIPNIEYLDQIDPLLLLWDNHDIRDVRTHALAFATNVGRGRLLVSA
ncbi:MAG: sugar-binding domain-containing protein, partial [Planctomycetaceae bacterium]